MEIEYDTRSYGARANRKIRSYMKNKSHT